jgi:hypothetical protein
MAAPPTPSAPRSTPRTPPPERQGRAPGGAAARSPAPSPYAVPGAPLNDNEFLTHQSAFGAGVGVGVGGGWPAWERAPCLRGVRSALVQLLAARLAALLARQTRTLRPPATSHQSTPPHPLPCSRPCTPFLAPAGSGAFIDAVAHTPTQDPLEPRHAAARLTPSNYAPGE